ncbi:hypothetical protein [Nonomuraea soli]|uniref:Uncharacterized protein n=1 Tax=Nonomuraea soli TaxID=1032476 RepID=A0A7W0CT01_9ACTN|nr:hypothetical protein [Nonomuraea soli]MBA2896643.1 hypothetical protein [Nonomuraea soli]
MNLFKRPCPITFVPADGSPELECTRTGWHGPFHATDRERFTRLPGRALVNPRKPAPRKEG